MNSFRLPFFCLLLLFGVTLLPAQNSTFTVTRAGTTPALDAAIDHGIAIWGHHLHSSVPIKINLIYTPMTTFGPLAITIPNGSKNFPNAPFADTWYPSCLANAITANEGNPGEADMDIYFNADFSWYFGLTGSPGPTKYDFVTVFLHEVAHGLGIATLAEVENGSGEGSLSFQDSTSLAPIVTSFPFPNLQGEAAVFSQFVQNGSGDSLIDTTLFPNPSLALAGQFTGNDLWFTGPQASAANGNTPPKLFAPSTFNSGSSTMHLNEGTYPVGSGNSCMTPFISKGEVEHSPGPILLGILEDLGWTVDLTTALPDWQPGFTQVKAYPNPFVNTFTLEFTAHQAGIVQLELYTLQGQLVYSHEESVSPGTHQLPIETTDIANSSLYIYRIKLEEQTHQGKILHLN